MSNFVPAEWTFDRIDTLLARRIRDFGSFSTTKLITFLDSGIPFIKSESVKQGTINFKSVSYIAKDVHEALDKSYVNPGDILFTKIGAIGRAALYKGELGVCNSNAATAKITIDGKKANSQFVTYQLVSERVSREFEKSIVSTPPRINLGDINAMKIELPPLPEQKKIAAILTSVDEVIEKTQAQIDKLKDLKTGMMQELLTRGVGVDGKPHTEFKDSPVGRIPKGWEVKPLADVVERVIDCEHKTAPYVEKSEYMVVRTSNVRNGELVLEDMKFTHSAGFKEWTKRAVPSSGDVLFTREAPAGESCLVPSHYKVCMGQRMVLLRPSNDVIDADFFSMFLTSEMAKKRIFEMSIGTTVSRINIEDIKKIPCVLPPKTEQKKIAEAITSVQGLLQKKQQKTGCYQKH